MVTGYYPFNSDTNKYVNIITDCIKDKEIEVINVDINQKSNFTYELVNLNWFESIFRKRYISAMIQFYKKINFIKNLKKNNIKIVWTVHNKIPHDGKYTFLAVKLMKLLVKEADGIIIHCKDTMEILKKLDQSLDISKVHYIPHPNYHEIYNEKEIDFKKELKLDNQLVYLFIGQVRPYKNVELIIKAAKENKKENVKFIIAGNPSSKSYKKELLSLIGDSDNIVPIFKYIEDDEIVPLMKASDVVLLPYDLKSSLNSGVAILAFTHGKTVICPEIGTLNDFENKDLFYSYLYKDENEHLEKLSEAIEKAYEDYVEDKEVLKEKGEELKKIMYERYTFDEVSKEYKEAYRKVIEKENE